MAFLQRNLYTPESSFTPLFRLLEDFDNYSRENGDSQSSTRRTIAHWQPKFDVRETGEAYELHGELPGVKKEDVQIEFTDEQSIQIRGKVERTYTAGTPPAGAITESGEHGRAKSPHRATVEDDKEEASSNSNNKSQVVKSSGSPKQKPADSAKYWLTERSVGEFSRSFSFPNRVNQDGVTASFKDGILSVVVPKATKPEPRRITVS
ncbi:sHSP family [Trichoderma novae-zelandiae]